MGLECDPLQYYRRDTIRANTPAKDNIVDVWVSTINKPQNY